MISWPKTEASSATTAAIDITVMVLRLGNR